MLDGLPSLASDNGSDSLFIEAEASRQGAERHPVFRIGPEFEHLGFGKFRRRVSSSSHTSTACTSLQAHVDKVLSLRPKEQVGRIDTRRIITSVADHHAIWDRAVMNLPTDTVSFEVLSESPHLPIASWATRTNPRPTFVSVALCDMFPELLSKRLVVWHAGSIPEVHHHV